MQITTARPLAPVEATHPGPASSPRRACRRPHLLADAASAPEYGPFRALVPRARLAGGCAEAVTRWGNRGLRVHSWFSTVSDLPDTELVLALAGRQWVGVGAPKSGLVDRLSIDLDADEHDEASVTACRERYRRLVAALEPDQPPVVFQTPSGGLRVWFRVPPMPEEFMRSGTGALRQLLADAGLEVAKGALELFPSTRLIDRLPFGPRMPLLDADSLDVRIPEAESITSARELRERTPDLVERLERVLMHLEDWLDAPCEKLAERLSRVPTTMLVTGGVPVTRSTESRDNGTPLHSDGRPSASGDDCTPGVERRRTEAVLRDGLVGPRSRYRCEYEVATLLANDPAAAGRAGLPGCDGSETSIAGVTASWLALRNNGWSEEWRDSVERHGVGAQDAWRERYLAEGVVRRAMATARSRTWSPRRPTLSGEGRQPLAEQDWARLAHIFDDVTRFGDLTASAARFRSEVWCMSLFTAARWQMLQGHASPCTDLTPFPRHFGGDPAEWVRVALPSKWMERWPGGSAYRRHLVALTRAGLLVRLPPANDFGSWRDRHRLSKRECLPAYEYLVPRPTMTPHSTLDGSTLQAVADALSNANTTASERGRDGRGWDPLEVQHLLALHDMSVSGDERFHWYGRYGKSGYRLRDIAARARQIATRVTQR